MRIRAGGKKEAGGGRRRRGGGEERKKRRRQEDKEAGDVLCDSPERGTPSRGGRVEPLVKGGKQGARYGGI